MKKAIDWFALVLGVALALLGARWMWTGWDIVQAERGWAAVISGSVMLSGGLIVAMLAWTVMRLTGAPVVARKSSPAFEEPPRPVRKASIGAPAVTAAAGVAAAAVATEATFGRGKTPDDDIAAPADEASETPPPLQPPAPPTVGELLRMSEDRAARETHDKRFEGPDALVAPVEEVEEVQKVEEVEEVDKKAGGPALAEPEKPAPSPAKEKAEIIEKTKVDEAVEEVALPEPPPEPELSKPEPEVAPPPAPPVVPEPPPPPAPSMDEPVYDDWLERTAREFDRELGRDAAPKGEPPPDLPSEPPKPEPAVVGRYSSGDTNYLMFADGSIEAQTPEGVMRFASLTELKRFVEKRN